MRFATRTLVIAIATGLLVVPGSAQTPEKPAAPAAQEDPVGKAYAEMPEAERKAIQGDLIWTGDYAGGIDGDFGPRSLAAVRAFQKRNRGNETGVLTAKERALLKTAADRRRAAVGWRIAEEKVSGVRLGIPAKLFPKQRTDKTGVRWLTAKGQAQAETFRISGEGVTLQSEFENQRDAEQRKVTYSVMRDDFFVVSGEWGARKFYVRAQGRDGQVRGFSVVYDQTLAATYDPITIAMSGSFEGFPAAPVAAKPARRKVEYGSGAFVTAEGHVATARDLIEGCHLFNLAGYGPADLIVDDKESGLALLRVYGVRDLKPLALSAAAPAGDLTLVGVADPARQRGGGDVSVATARVLAAQAGKLPGIEPAPALGFSGAAAVDREGRLAGIVDVSTQVVAGAPASSAPARLIPAAALKGVLDAQKLAAAGAPAGSIEAAKAAAVRVICLRK